MLYESTDSRPAWAQSQNDSPPNSGRLTQNSGDLQVTHTMNKENMNKTQTLSAPVIKSPTSPIPTKASVTYPVVNSVSPKYTSPHFKNSPSGNKSVSPGHVNKFYKKSNKLSGQKTTGPIKAVHKKKDAGNFLFFPVVHKKTIELCHCKPYFAMILS